MKALRSWRFANRSGSGFALEVEDRHRLVVKVLENDLIPVLNDLGQIEHWAATARREERPA